jgi:predicted outer membrane protein
MITRQLLQTTTLLVLTAGIAFGQTDNRTLPAPALTNTPPNPTGAANANNPGATSESQPGQGLAQKLGKSGVSSDEITPIDRSFAQQAIGLGHALVSSSREALKTSKNSQVRMYAQTVVNDGEPNNAQLQRIAQSLQIGVDHADGKAQEELAQLQAAKGTVFDGLYGQLQFDDQKAAFELYKHEADQGRNRQLKSFAVLMKGNVSTFLQKAELVRNGTLDRRNPNCPPDSPAKAGCP